MGFSRQEYWSAGEQDGGGVSGHGVHLSPQIHQEYTIRHRSACRTPAERDRSTRSAEKNIYNHTNISRMKELGRKTGVLVGLDLRSAGGGTEAAVRSPQQGKCLSQRRNI